MAITTVMFDTVAAPGSKLDPLVAAEVEHLAPGLQSGEVQETTLADGSVSNPKIKAGAVTSEKIAQGGVEAINLAADAVGTAALQDDSVTAAKAGTGVVTAYDGAGNPIESRDVYLTVAQYNAIETPDPNTTYYIS